MRGGPHLERDLGGKRANRRYFLRRMKDGDSAPLRPQSDNAFRQNCESVGGGVSKVYSDVVRTPQISARVSAPQFSLF